MTKSVYKTNKIRIVVTALAVALAPLYGYSAYQGELTGDDIVQFLPERMGSDLTDIPSGDQGQGRQEEISQILLKGEDGYGCVYLSHANQEDEPTDSEWPICDPLETGLTQREAVEVAWFWLIGAGIGAAVSKKGKRGQGALIGGAAGAAVDVARGSCVTFRDGSSYGNGCRRNHDRGYRHNHDRGYGRSSYNHDRGYYSRPSYNHDEDYSRPRAWTPVTRQRRNHDDKDSNTPPLIYRNGRIHFLP